MSRTKTTNIGMLPSASEPRLVVIGNPGSNRIDFLNEARARRGQGAVILVPWLDMIEGRVSLTDSIRAEDWVRIESPGRDATVEAALVGVGRTAEKGELFYPRHWYDGFCRIMKVIQAQLADAPPHRTMNDPREIAALFDKTETHARFLAAGLPVPRRLEPVNSLAALADGMKELRVRQVFVKLAHGSSASGAMAIRTDGQGRWRAYTTVECDSSRLYNSRRIRSLDDPDQIDSFLALLAPHGLHIEEWLPKASLHGNAFDIRALVIGGKLRHVVGRLSRTPMTNLHLLNRRADSDTVRATVGESAWAALTEVAERAATVFPNSLHLGLDVMWLPGFRRLALLEANAFGDLLPGTLWQGQTTYDTELEAMTC